MGRKGRGKPKQDRSCESCAIVDPSPSQDEPSLPPRWRPLPEKTLYRCEDCKRYRRVSFDGREMSWSVEELPPSVEPFLRGRAKLKDLWPAVRERGWTQSVLLDWVVKAEFDFAELARDALRRIGAAGTSDWERSRLLVLLRCAATGESGQALWRAIRARRRSPVELDLSPLLAIAEREDPGDPHGHRLRVEEVERISWALLGTDHHRAVDLVEPGRGQRERLHRATGHVPEQLSSARRSEDREQPSRRRRAPPPSELDSLEEVLAESDEDDPEPGPVPRLAGAAWGPAHPGSAAEPPPLDAVTPPPSWRPLATCRSFLLALPFLLPGVLLNLLFVEGIAPETQVGQSGLFAIPFWCLSGGLLVAGAVRARIPESTLPGLAISRAVEFATNGICCWIGSLLCLGLATLAAMLVSGQDREAELTERTLLLAAAFMLPWLGCVARMWPGYVLGHLTLAARARRSWERQAVGCSAGWSITKRRGAFLRCSLPVLGSVAVLVLPTLLWCAQSSESVPALLSLHGLAVPFVTVLAVERTAALLDLD